MLSRILNSGCVRQAVSESTVTPVSLHHAAQGARNLGQVGARSRRPLGHVLARSRFVLPLDAPSTLTHSLTPDPRGGVNQFRLRPCRTRTTVRSGVVTSRIQAVRNGSKRPGYRLWSAAWWEVNLANLVGRATLRGGSGPLGHRSAPGGPAGSSATPLLRHSGSLCPRRVRRGGPAGAAGGPSSRPPIRPILETPWSSPGRRPHWGGRRVNAPHLHQGQGRATRRASDRVCPVVARFPYRAQIR